MAAPPLARAGTASEQPWGTPPVPLINEGVK